MTAKEIINYMETLCNEGQCEALMRFFKMGPGQYGKGDEFLGKRGQVVFALSDRDALKLFVITFSDLFC